MLVEININSVVYYAVLAIALAFIFYLGGSGSFNNLQLTVLVGASLVIIIGVNMMFPQSKCSIEKYTPLTEAQMNLKTNDSEYTNPTDPALIAKNKRDRVAGDKIKAKQTGEEPFDQGNPLNTIPLGENPYVNDYVYLPQTNWIRPFERPPVCITEKRCPVCPTFTSGTNAELLSYRDTEPVATIEVDTKFLNNKLTK